MGRVCGACGSEPADGTGVPSSSKTLPAMVHTAAFGIDICLPESGRWLRPKRLFVNDPRFG